MPKLLKKSLFSFLVSLVVLFSFAPYLSPAKAQTTWYSQDPFEWYLKVYDQNTSPANEIFGERYTAAQVQWVVYSFLFLPVRMVETVVGENTISCFIKGFGTGTVDLNNCGQAVIDAVTKITSKIFPNPISYNNKPFIAQVFDSSNRSISGIGYTKNLLKKFSLVSEVKAQGYGYTGLSWVQKYWTGFRNISYALLVLVIIVFAFMIMFRVKLSPQTVISVQSALPKVIVAMILITFSYAIAGFAVDLMYVISGLFALLLNLAGFSTNLTSAYATIAGTGAGYEIFSGFWVLFMMLAYTIVFFVSAIVSLFTTLLAGVDLFGMVLAVVFILISVWVLILCIWYTFKIPYVLIKTLISVYISIITAPVQILAGTIVPSMGFGAWFKRLMSDILVFPMVGLLFWFAWATLWSSFGLAFKDVGAYWVNFGTISWIPGIIGTKGLGQPSGIDGLIFLGISFGIITLIPKVPELLKSIFMGEKFSFGTAMGEAYGPVGGIAKGVSGTAQGAALGGGAVWLGTKLEGRGNYYVQKAGQALTGYGNRALGGAFNKKGITETEEPGVPHK